MIIGMDFGTTNSGIATYDGQRLQIIPIDGNTIARTALYITNDRQFYIGREAIDTYFAQNLNRPVNISRVHVGEIAVTAAELPTFYRDVYIDKDLLSPGRLFVSFKTALSSLDYLGTMVESHFYFLEDIVALYLYMAKQRAEAQLQQEVKQIALGRPVRFAFDPSADALARERLLKAAFRAGYEEVYLQYEPIAAAYHYESTIDRAQIVLVFDFGGGTLDISVLRVGDPKTRAVIATGGVPIAGDVFDSKLARARLPKHFGEGTFYRTGGQKLPVPSSFYEAFANWQEMLQLQRPDLFTQIERIEQTAQRPQMIRALRNLVSSSYGLKMFDIVEGAKRQLSASERASIRLEGQGFDVAEPVTRFEFEGIIGPETRLIEDYLDNLLREAEIKPDDIDVVIRTGGSSQIPAFVNMLETRFGREKVRAVDTFSSVTSGLGIIAHRIEAGEIDAKVYRSSDFEESESPEVGDVAVDFEVLKKYVTLTESRADNPGASGVVALASDGKVHASLKPPDQAGIAAPLMISAAADEQILIMTSEYHLFLKSVQQLATLETLGLTLAETESFHADAFGSEYVSGIARWTLIKPNAPAALISTTGYFKAFKGEFLISSTETPMGYHPQRIKGDPFSVIGVGSQVIAFNTTGRVVRLPMALLQEAQEGRLMKLDKDDRLIAVFAVERSAQFLLIGADGTIMHLRAANIPQTDELQDAGTKMFPKRDLQSVALWTPDASLWIATNQRVRSYETTGIPSGKLKLNPKETLISLITHVS
ncbi:MAG TPA: Hsp70 family protein [Phototrophicaceae bacterium]|nr:Hsp70 family protein [Phototrophicaceae bacterium]